MKHYKTYRKKETKRRIKIRSRLLLLLCLSVAFAGYWGYMSYWPTYTHAEISLQRPQIDNRSPQDHVWDIMTNEYDLTIQEKINAFNIIDCESFWNPYAIGDNGKSTGLWQIHRGYHPEVTPDKGFDIYYSTRWAINKYLKDGRSWRAWSCGKILNLK